MAEVAEVQEQSQARESVRRITSYDVSRLPRLADLGKTLSFEAAVEPAQRLIGLFEKIPLEALSELPTEHVAKIRKQADNVFNLLQQIESFTSSVQSPASARDALVQQLSQQYTPAFETLFPYISYCVARTVDFNRLERDGRAAVQNISDQTKTALEGLQQAQSDATRIIEEVRQAAAEQGVSQQAHYFKTEADNNDKSAQIWLRATAGALAVLIAYCVSVLFLYKWDFLLPYTTYQGIQLAVGKVLLFGVLVYVSVLCARNFLSHKHNCVVNRHRQNALMTFRSLVDAAGDQKAQDVVLTHAAANIFQPQDSGFVRQQSSFGAASSASLIRALFATDQATPT